MRSVTMLVVLAACATAEPREAPVPAGASWRWHVLVDPGLTRLDVRMCSDARLPARLSVDQSAGTSPLATTTPGWRVGTTFSNDTPTRCLDYRVAVDRLTRAERVGGDVITRPGQWLLRPSRWPAGVVAELTFELPAGVRVSAPYPAADDRTYLVDATLTQRLAHVALGRFETTALEVGGATFEVVTLDADRRATDDGIRAWLRAAARAVTELYPRFPAARVQVIVRPVQSTRGPVVFGLTTRGGGAGLYLLLAASAEDTELVGEWVAVHEMLHLGLPWTRDSEAWMQEGFVTYYQEVVRTRAGLLSVGEGWQRLHDGFHRGRRSGTGRPLADESAAMARTGAYRRVYWAGAALALTLDVELRAQSNGNRSLDDLMRFWQERFGDDRVHHSGIDLLHAADTWLDGGACVTTCRLALERSDMPDLTEIYSALGLRPNGDRVELDVDRNIHRDGIMAPRR